MQAEVDRDRHVDGHGPAVLLRRLVGPLARADSGFRVTEVSRDGRPASALVIQPDANTIEDTTGASPIRARSVLGSDLESEDVAQEALVGPPEAASA